MKPAKGPATPISVKIFRFLMGARMLMTAPNVPNKDSGNGMKKGKDAGALWYRAAK